MTPSSSFKMGQQYPPHQVSPTSVTDASYLYSHAPPPLSSSSNHRSTKSPSKSHQPRGSTKLGGHGSGEEQPTPQNLRDSPERLAKVKTEMCTYFLKGGVKACPFGANCKFSDHFLHIIVWYPRIVHLLYMYASFLIIYHLIMFVYVSKSVTKHVCIKQLKQATMPMANMNLKTNIPLYFLWRAPVKLPVLLHTYQGLV